jgi:adenylylsulfate kinase
MSWRVLATLTTVVLVFAFTGKLALAAGIGMIEVVAKLLIYYAHERIWDKISWGRTK